MGNKSTKLVVLERVNKVSELLLDGFSRSDIIQYASNEKWELSNRQVDDYIQKATHLYESEVVVDREKIYKAHIRKREKLFKAAVKVGNLKVAASILNDLAKIDGSAIDRKELNIKGNLGTHDLSDEDLDKMIKKEINNQGKDGTATQG
jgi:hypothetical protein